MWNIRKDILLTVVAIFSQFGTNPVAMAIDCKTNERYYDPFVDGCEDCSNVCSDYGSLFDCHRFCGALCKKLREQGSKPNQDNYYCFQDIVTSEETPTITGSGYDNDGAEDTYTHNQNDQYTVSTVEPDVELPAFLLGPLLSCIVALVILNVAQCVVIGMIKRRKRLANRNYHRKENYGPPAGRRII